MIPILFTCWAFSAPMGYVIGDLFVARYPFEDRDLARAVPWITALLTPLASILALVILVQIEATNQKSEKDQ